MTASQVTPGGLLRTHDPSAALRVVRSALSTQGTVTATPDFRSWFAEQLAVARTTTVAGIDFADLVGWRFADDTGNLVHDSGKFFAVEGLSVAAAHGPVASWSQPIINQPETGVLGILVKEFDGVLHCLMQAKMEPGNCNVLQLSPTVQATRSNYTAVHRGRSVPYLDMFLSAPPQSVLADVLQSEQGSWFYRKRNRNIVVEATADVEVLPGFCWLSLGQVHALLTEDHLVNMNTRTVLSCLSFSGPNLVGELGCGASGFRSALVRSIGTEWGALHTDGEILSWITDLRSRREVEATPIPLREVRGWRRLPDRITHDTGVFFDIRAVAVDGGGREIDSWTQPIIAPHGLGVVAFLVARFSGVLHILVGAQVEPGHLDFVELAPTVQCTPDSYEHLPAEAWPPFLDDVLAAPADRIRFETELSEEGGRFYHARGRYVIVEVDPVVANGAGPARHRWMTMAQIVGLLRHSHYVNVQARTLVACLHSLVARLDDDSPVAPGGGA
ncbi:NDP-hexose 2,3-dehydratase family protein [Streptomyces sp. NPDC001351]|uniref:NDP-hexose 2,3-dehydratase family protein n=1 Tax=Streptomyces sp. NPDC001351 TaxID=3364564 RepID=UPI00369F57B0